MKRMLGSISLAICLLAGVASAGSSGRTVERTYQPVYVEPGVPAGSITHSNGVTFRTRANEHFVSVAIEDESGLPVPARITQGENEHPDHEYDVDEEFCGSTPQPVAIRAREPVTVWMSHGTCDGATNPQSAGGWTTGTVTATFSRS